MKLDLDQYLALPWPDRKRVDRWLRAHGINPDDTFGLELDLHHHNEGLHMKSPKVWLALAAYMATIPLANWMISNVGTEAFPGGPHMIGVGFGLTAPSGVLVIGAALAARDAVHRLAGWRWAVGAIAVGVALSWFVNPAVALASAVAFGLGELADLGVYLPLARRNLPLAVAASGVVGGIIDTFMFLQIAFGSTQFWQGQIVGKTIVALTCGLVVWGWRAVPVGLTARQA